MVPKCSGFTSRQWSALFISCLLLGGDASRPLAFPYRVNAQSVGAPGALSRAWQLPVLLSLIILCPSLAERPESSTQSSAVHVSATISAENAELEIENAKLMEQIARLERGAKSGKDVQVRQAGVTQHLSTSGRKGDTNVVAKAEHNNVATGKLSKSTRSRSEASHKSVSAHKQRKQAPTVVSVRNSGSLGTVQSLANVSRYHNATAVDTSFWCGGWCAYCNPYPAMQLANGTIAVPKPRKIYIQRNQGSWMSNSYIGGMVLLGPYGVLAAGFVSAFNSMLRGCPRVQFKYNGDDREIVNWGFLAARSYEMAASRSTTKEQQDFWLTHFKRAKDCAKVASPKNFRWNLITNAQRDCKKKKTEGDLPLLQARVALWRTRSETSRD